MKELEENITPANIGGMGPVLLPTATQVGSGDVPANSGDAEEEYKKKKKKMKKLQNFESFTNKDIVTEGRVKQFTSDLKDMIKNIKSGYGWIDPEYVEDTWENSSDSIDFELVKSEIYRQLIKAGLLAKSDDDNEEEAGEYIKSLKQLGIAESVVNEAKAVKVTKKEWPYVEFKIGSTKHKVEFDYEDIIDDHGNEGQDQYWLGKDDDGKEWSIDVYADYNGDVQDVHYDTIVAESIVNEAKGFKNTTDFEKFLIEIDGMGESQIRKIMGKDYIDTPGYYKDEKGNYDDVEDFMRSNMGTSEFEKLESWWENNVAESVVNEAFSRMSKDTIENELFTASQALTTYYDWLKAGNDSGKGESIDHVISLLKKCKSNIKRFNKPEEVKGTAFESLVTEKFKFSKKEVEAAANLIASAISQADMVKAKVHDLEYVKGKGAGFEISIDGEKYDGGSYTVKDNGDVVNSAIGNTHPNAVYNTIGNKDIADVFINMEKYESLVSEAKFVKEFNKEVLDAKTREEVLDLYPNAKFFTGKSDHFFGELDDNLFFKAYYTKAQKEFEIKSVYSEKGSNYVHLYNESIVNEAATKSAGLVQFAADEKAEGKNAEIHLATFDGSGMEAQSTNKTWDDGVPVTKNFTRGGYKRIAPKGEIYIIESNDWWYFKDKGTWYAVKRKDYGTPPFEY